MNILDEIIKSKKADVKIIKEKLENIDEKGPHTLSLEVDLLTNNYNKLSRCKIEISQNEVVICKNIFSRQGAFNEYIKKYGNFVIIGEIKRGSPSKGLFAENLSISNTLKNYIQGGIKCISVLTNNEYFYGSYRDLYKVRSSFSGYILNKEFIIDEIQIDIAKKMGADIILLIASALDKNRIIDLYRYASSEGLDVIVEVHDKLELEFCLSFSPKIIGINNRDLKTFDTNISNSLDMISGVSKSELEKTVFISESGIGSQDDIDVLKQAGFSGVLIGESLIRNIDDISRVLGSAN
ncbi:MAG: indole-3-glycerol phosphate synthase TrpC [Acidaminobacteraceae bacterium]